MTALSVVMSGRFAGVATADGSATSLRVGFEYDSGYLALPDATPLSVSAPLQPGRHEIGIWLDGLLSDNHLVRERWKTEHKTPTTRAIDLLASPVGRDCAGAVQFCPEEEMGAMLTRGGGLRELSQHRVARMIETLRQDEAAWSQGTADSAFSLGGAQAKTALRYDQGRWWLPYDDFPTTHILKPGIGHLSDNEIIEHISQRAAVLLGIDAARTQCLKVRGKHALLVTRYDRLRTQTGEYQRVHQEDLCQALGVPVTRKYQNQQGPDVSGIAGLLWANSSHPETDVRLFRDALIYNWLIVGADAHAKNYSLLLNRNEMRLAPVYDVCSVLPYRHLIERGKTIPVRDLTLAMRGGARDYTIHRADYRPAWERTSQALGLPQEETLNRAEELAQRVFSAVEQAIDETPRWARSSPFVARLHKEIKRRADHCQFVKHMHSPSRYAKVTPGHDIGLSFRTTSEAGADRPVTKKRCTHIGERSDKRCRLPPGHRPPHRYYPK